MTFLCFHYMLLRAAQHSMLLLFSDALSQDQPDCYSAAYCRMLAKHVATLACYFRWLVDL